MARVPNVASERPTTEDAVTTEKSKIQQYEDATIKLAYHVAWDLEHNSKLSQLSLDAVAAYRAAREAWYAEIDAMDKKGGPR
jgi:hypothetical protein